MVNMYIKSQYIYLLLGLLVSNLGFGQILNKRSELNATQLKPKVVSFNRNDFMADPQFWTMCENEDGTLIFGNNDGAITFDGEHWQKINLPNNSSIRSILKTDKGEIYAGGYNEIGTLHKNKFGKYVYTSLINELHLDGKNLENLWQIHQLKNNIIYRSFSELILIIGKRVVQFPANKSFIYSEKVNNNYLVQDIDFGIYRLNYDEMKLTLVFDAKSILNEDLACILPTKIDHIVTLITKSGVVYSGDIVNKTIKKTNSVFEGFKKDQVSCGIKVDNNDYLIGTRSSRIIKITSDGQIIRNSELFSGLSNATIHYLYQTKNKNIWVLQNNGLNLLDYKSPFISIFDQASVYDILVKNNMIYVATNNGVYQTSYSNVMENSLFNFKKIKNLQGQTWAIQECDDDIIISHDNGIYKLDNGVLQKIGNQNGFWKLTKIKNKPGHYLGSNYNGLYLIEKTSKGWIVNHKINGFEESTRDIIADYEPNTYWVCHGYKGVYKIHINSDYSRIDVVDHFTNKNGFQSPYNINVFKWKGKIVFTTNTGIYTYNATTNKFELYKPLNRLFDTSINTRKLIECNDRTWFIQDDEAGYFMNNKPKLYKDLFLNLKGSFNRGMESIYPLNDNKVLFGTNMGLYLYRIFDNSNNSVVPTVISQITYSQNQKLEYMEINSLEKNIQFPNKTDILRFEFAAPKMISSAKINYSYKLENIDENWSPWQSNPYKEYTHLRPGNYKFYVKSRNLAGVVGKGTSFEFSILPKWYQTNLALCIYFIIGILSVYFITTYVRRKIGYERLKARNEIEKSQQLLELELEKLKLKHDKEEIQKDKLLLEENIIDKSKELANYTLLLSQKKSVFSELQYDLKLLRDLLKSEESRKKIFEIFQKLNQHKIGEEYMEIFDVNFEKVNHDFFEKLKHIDSTLTKRELRLCAFVKMDLTNKEIAPLLNISIRGVESARYRVRKKLNVQHEDNFISYLNDLSI